MNNYNQLTSFLDRLDRDGVKLFLQDENEQLSTRINRMKYRQRIGKALRAAERSGMLSNRERKTLAELDHITVANTGSTSAPEVANFYNPREGERGGYDGFSIVIAQQNASHQHVGDITG